MFELLGGRRRPLPAYASTTIGDDDPDGLGSGDAYARFAERCYDLGYRAFKIHGWLGGDLQKEIDIADAVGRAVGDRMALMDDVSSALRTLSDAMRLGHVLDDHRYVWYEDPYADTGISAAGNRRLREKLRTPLLITEHLRSLEPKVDFYLAGGTDFLRADPDFDGGITGAMKIAAAAEGLGTDVEIHFAGPAHRHCMTAIRNTNYYEMGLLHPKFDLTSPASGVAENYADGLEAIDADGCVMAPDGPGLGVVYDWDKIRAHQISAFRTPDRRSAVARPRSADLVTTEFSISRSREVIPRSGSSDGHDLREGVRQAIADTSMSASSTSSRRRSISVSAPGLTPRSASMASQSASARAAALRSPSVSADAIRMRWAGSDHSSTASTRRARSAARRVRPPARCSSATRSVAAMNRAVSSRRAAWAHSS